VLTIKQTLYRTSLDSRVVHHLIRAAELGKQVVVMVEIKARFDEQANIEWARKLEQAGAHVVYGLVGLKTHCKTLLVVRREGGVLRRYVHIGTGNYNTRTSRTYVDLGLFTCRAEIGADVSDLFNILTGLSRQRTFRRLVVAPTGLRERFLQLVEREAQHAAAGRPSGIILKMNALIDSACVDALYRASTAGVEVDIVVRGACTLVPGVPGLSEHIRVRSIIGEFLEHSRIWRFVNGGEPEWLIGSGDLMDRNLDRRIEAFVPIDDPEAQRLLDDTLAALLADDRRAWALSPDGEWQRVERLRGTQGSVDAQQVLKEHAARRAQEGASQRAPGLGSLQPWA
jgi:polyphosphate kinase